MRLREVTGAGAVTRGDRLEELSVADGGLPGSRLLHVGEPQQRRGRGLQGDLLTGEARRLSGRRELEVEMPLGASVSARSAASRALAPLIAA
jgi:hypothetical protein